MTRTIITPAVCADEPPVFRVGELVRVVGNTAAHQFQIGEIVVLISAHNHEFWGAQALSDWWFVKESDIEHASVEPEPAASRYGPWEGFRNDYDYARPVMFRLVKSVAQYAYPLPVGKRGIVTLDGTFVADDEGS